MDPNEIITIEKDRATLNYVFYFVSNVFHFSSTEGKHYVWEKNDLKTTHAK